MDEKYYHENSCTTILSEDGSREVTKELVGKKCHECGSDIILVTFMEESGIYCGSDMYNKHDIGYRLFTGNPEFSDKPRVISND